MQWQEALGISSSGLKYLVRVFSISPTSLGLTVFGLQVSTFLEELAASSSNSH